MPTVHPVIELTFANLGRMPDDQVFIGVGPANRAANQLAPPPPRNHRGWKKVGMWIGLVSALAIGAGIIGIVIFRH